MPEHHKLAPDEEALNSGNRRLPLLSIRTWPQVRMPCIAEAPFILRSLNRRPLFLSI